MHICIHVYMYVRNDQLASLPGQPGRPSPGSALGSSSGVGSWPRRANSDEHARSNAASNVKVVDGACVHVFNVRTP